MKCFLSCCLLGITLLAGRRVQAQYADNPDFTIWPAAAGDTAYVYGRMANVRSAAGLDAPVIDSLVCGTPVLVKAKEGGAKVKGIYAPWIKVSYTVSGRQKEGYLWLGMMALGAYAHEGIRFLYGLERIEMPPSKDAEQYQPPYWYVRIRVLDASGSLLEDKETRLEAAETSFTEAKLLGDMGLDGVRNIFRMSFSGEACGIPSYFIYYAWDGKQLLPLPGKMTVGDAGVYYHDETFLFPKEPGGQAGKIILLTEEGEATDESAESNDSVFKVKKSRIVYRWDGRKAIKL